LGDDDGNWDRFVGIPPGTSNFGVSTGADYWEPVSADADQWQFVAVVFTPGSIVFYKDGTRYDWEGTPVFGTTTRTFEIGRNVDPANHYAGMVDEVSVYDRALTDAEIQSIRLGGADALSCRDADGICVTHDCDDGTPSAGSTVFPDVLTAPSDEALVWSTAMDVRWRKGDLTGLDNYTMDEAGSLYGAASLDISMDSPVSGSGMYYMVRQQGCGSWQTSLGAEPGRDAQLPLP
jgi:hypothetical protein